MRAINTHKLKAHRDNRNHWKIAPEDLRTHYADSVREERLAHTDETSELREKLAIANSQVEAAERARDQAEADRDRWQNMAEKLTEKRRFIWPWT
jgi:ribosome-binding protein aMBF1 (putative translation factor)